MNSSKVSSTANDPKTYWQIRAEAERERRRRRIESLSQSIGEADINFARYNRWMLTTHPTLARAQGLEIDASPFLRSEVERFEAWNLKQAAVMGIDKLSDEELLERYHQLQTKIVESFETEGNRDGIES